MDKIKLAIDIMDSAALQISTVVDIKDNSSEFITRRRYVFNNRYFVTVIKGCGSYENNDKLEFEYAIFDESGWATRDFFPDHNDDVIGWQSIEDICLVLEMVGNA